MHHTGIHIFSYDHCTNSNNFNRVSDVMQQATMTCRDGGEEDV